MMPRRKRLLWIAPLALLGIAAFAFIGGEIVLHLWNWLLPAIFGWRAITFWQAIGMIVLCRILFGGWGVRTSSRSNILQKMNERWKSMTPEERERYRQAMRAKWGFGPPPAETKEQ